jgi:hypothetical protein
MIASVTPFPRLPNPSAGAEHPSIALYPDTARESFHFYVISCRATFAEFRIGVTCSVAAHPTASGTPLS